MVEEKFQKIEKLSHEEKISYQEKQKQITTLKDLIKQLKQRENKQIQEIKQFIDYFTNDYYKQKINEDYNFLLNIRIYDKVKENLGIKKEPGILMTLVKNRKNKDLIEKILKDFPGLKKFTNEIYEVEKEIELNPEEIEKQFLSDENRKDLQKEFENAKKSYRKMGKYFYLDPNFDYYIQSIIKLFLINLKKAKNKKEYWDKSDERKFLAKLPKIFKLNKKLVKAIKNKEISIEKINFQKLKNEKIDDENLALIKNKYYKTIWKKTFKDSKLSSNQILRELEKLSDNYILIKK